MAVKTWVWVVLGVGGLFIAGFLALFGFGIYMFTQHVDWESATRASAEERFEQARMQFEGEVPLITITGAHGPEISRREEQSYAKAEALHVLTWDPDASRLVSLSFPFWLLRRIGSGTINLSEDDFDPFEDLEWHGPGLMLDHAREGDDRVLVWAQCGRARSAPASGWRAWPTRPSVLAEYETHCAA